MPKLLFLGALAVGILGVLVATAGNAADIDFVDSYHGRCHAVLQGTITAGDADRLREILPGDPELGFYAIDAPTLCLNSPGGGFAEALEIARYLREAGIRTHIAAGDECLSACAISFLGGSRNNWEDALVNYQSRSMDATARLGFHGPSLQIPDGQFSRETVEEAFDLAILAAAQIFSRLDELRISNAFVLAFFDVPNNTFYEIDSPERVQELGVDVVGISPLPDRVADDRIRAVCSNAVPAM